MNYSQAISQVTKHVTAMKKLATNASIGVVQIIKKIKVIDMKKLLGSIMAVVTVAGECSQAAVRMDEWSLFQLR